MAEAAGEYRQHRVSDSVASQGTQRLKSVGSWAQIEAWAETEQMIMIRAHDRVLPVLESALPGPVFRSIRERLPRQS